MRTLAAPANNSLPLAPTWYPCPDESAGEQVQIFQPMMMCSEDSETSDNIAVGGAAA